MQVTTYIFLHYLYSSILIVSLLFTIFFFYCIKTYPQKDRIPLVYIYVMVFSNIIEDLIEIFDDVVPLFLNLQTYQWIRDLAGGYSVCIDDFAYSFPMFLTIIMVAERFYVIFYPTGKAFSDGKLWMYCLVLAILTMLLCLTPIFSGCPVSYDYNSFTMVSDCEHVLTYIFAKYNGVIPLVCMFLNIGLIFHVSHERRKTHSQNDPSSINRPSHEKTMFMQSILCTIFLLIYEITDTLIEIFYEEYMNFSESTRRIIYYTRNLTVGLRCFLVYFVGTPAIRKIVVEKVVSLVMREKKKVNTVMITGSRDHSSTNFK